MTVTPINTTPPDGRLDGPTPQQVLACPMEGNDADASTIREFLIALLAVVWDEGEGFSGKRPFGNSSWEYALYRALHNAGWVTVVYDESGYYVRDFADDERRKANRLIAEAIQSLATTGAAA